MKSFQGLSHPQRESSQAQNTNHKAIIIKKIHSHFKSDIDMRTVITPRKESNPILWIVIFILALLIQWTQVESANGSNKTASGFNTGSQMATKAF